MAPEKFKQHGFELELFKTSFFLIRGIVVPTSGNGNTPLQKRIFAIMGINSSNAAEYFNLPANSVLELGTVSKSNYLLENK